MKITREGNVIKWNKKVSVTLAPKDMFMFSPADRTVFVIHNENNSAVVTGYNVKGVAVGSYEYKNSRITRLFQRNGFANIVYSYSEPNGTLTWYQARLLTNGYCTEIYCLHCTEGVADAPDGREVGAVADSDKDAEVNEILASVMLSKPRAETTPLPVEEASVQPEVSGLPLSEPVTPVNPLLQPIPKATAFDDEDDIEDIEDIEETE